MKIEKIKEELPYVDEHYAEKDGDHLADMIGILKIKINEIIDALNYLNKIRGGEITVSHK